MSVEPNASRVMTLNSSIVVFPARCSACGCCCANGLDALEAKLAIEQRPGFTDFLGIGDFLSAAVAQSDSMRWTSGGRAKELTAPSVARPNARLYAGRLSLRSSALYRGSVASDRAPVVSGANLIELGRSGSRSRSARSHHSKARVRFPCAA